MWLRTLHQPIDHASVDDLFRQFLWPSEDNALVVGLQFTGAVHEEQAIECAAGIQVSDDVIQSLRVGSRFHLNVGEFLRRWQSDCEIDIGH